MTLVKYSWNPVEDNIMAEYDGQGNLLARYTTEPELYGNVISQYRNGQTSYFHHDGSGNTIAVTNDNGDVTDTRAYNAFGEITESTGTTEFPFQFVGQKGYYRDKETGEYSVRRRPYEPSIARWHSVDPIRFADGATFYRYAHGNPLRYVDPSGLSPQTREELSEKYHQLLKQYYRALYEAEYEAAVTPEDRRRARERYERNLALIEESFFPPFRLLDPKTWLRSLTHWMNKVDPGTRGICGSITLDLTAGLNEIKYKFLGAEVGPAIKLALSELSLIPPDVVVKSFNNLKCSNPKETRCCLILDLRADFDVNFVVTIKDVDIGVGKPDPTIEYVVKGSTRIRIGLCVKTNCDCPSRIPDKKIELGPITIDLGTINYDVLERLR